MAGLLQHAVSDIVSRLLPTRAGLGLSNPDLAPAGAWPVWYGKERAEPDDAVTVRDTTGKVHARSHGQRPIHHGVLIRVRAANERDGILKANAIADDLDADDFYKLRVEADGRTYEVQNANRTTDVVHLGQERDGTRWLFTINALVVVRDVTEG